MNKLVESKEISRNAIEIQMKIDIKWIINLRLTNTIEHFNFASQSISC